MGLDILTDKFLGGKKKRRTFPENFSQLIKKLNAFK